MPAWQDATVNTTTGEVTLGSGPDIVRLLSPKFEVSSGVAQVGYGLQVVMGGGSGEAAITDAVDFDGTNDYLTRGAGLTGAADADNGIFSAWVRLDGGDGSILTLLQSAVHPVSEISSGIKVVRLSSNKFLFSAVDTGDILETAFQTTSTFTAAATWLNVLVSWDLSAGATHLYVNDVDEKASVATDGSGNIDYTQTDWGIGALVDGSSKFNGCLAYFYFAPGQFLDFSVEANRRKFITAGGKPADLGADGSTPTGTAPLIYLNGDETDFQVNLGTGGDFTVTGTLTAADSSPSD